jgi:hypothetical protein
MLYELAVHIMFFFSSTSVPVSRLLVSLIASVLFVARGLLRSLS